MEKVIYLVRPPSGVSGDQFRLQSAQICQQLLNHSAVLGLSTAFADSAVQRAQGLTQERAAPLPQALFSLWLQSSVEQHQLADIIAPHVSLLEGYLVCESQVLQPPEHSGQRTKGTMQLCTFSKPRELPQQQFIDLWRNSHTHVAVDTQSTFGYRQNLVAATLTPGARPLSAIVEEHFPESAMDTPAHFFNAVGDEKKLQQHLQRMSNSCQRFIDFSTINVVHMSEYPVKPLFTSTPVQ